MNTKNSATNNAVTWHLLVGVAFLIALTATLLGQLSRERMSMPTGAAAAQATSSSGPGFERVFSRGPALRNLVF